MWTSGKCDAKYPLSIFRGKKIKIREMNACQLILYMEFVKEEGIYSKNFCFYREFTGGIGRRGQR